MFTEIMNRQYKEIEDAIRSNIERQLPSFLSESYIEDARRSASYQQRVLHVGSEILRSLKENLNKAHALDNMSQKESEHDH